MNLDPRLITVSPSRQRRDLGDLTDLKRSITELGIIEPLVIDEHNTLIAGERRLRSALELNLPTVPVYVRDQIPTWQREAMELEENIRRKSLTWQETVCAIARVHFLHKREAALTGADWGMLHTGELLGVSSANVCYATQIAASIDAKDPDICNASGIVDAYRILIDRKTREAQAELARRLTVLPTHFEAAVPGDTAPARSLSDPKPGVTGLSCTLANTDFRTWLPNQKFDVIYTDPPYAIDMDNIQQAGVGMNIEAVRATHDVASNRVLLDDFITIAVDTLPKHGWLVMWCDYTMLADLSNWLDEAGLRVQRWPFVWLKQHPCQNGMPYKNFTKTTEIAIVASKPDATLAFAGPPAHFLGAADKDAHKPTNPFWKPVLMHERIIEAISAPGAIICDPFAGSGSIPYAALRSGRSVCACEIDVTHYNDMAVRLQAMHSKGQTPDDLLADL